MQTYEDDVEVRIELRFLISLLQVYVNEHLLLLRWLRIQRMEILNILYGVGCVDHMNVLLVYQQQQLELYDVMPEWCR